MTASTARVEKAYDDPFVILHIDDVCEIMQRVKPSAVCVYLALATYANRKQANSCYPSMATIAKRANVSRRTVVHALEELQASEVITIEHRIDPDFGQKSNTYFLHRTRCAESAPPSANPVPTPGINSALPPMQNLHPNHMNTEPDEIEPVDDSSDDESLRRIASGAKVTYLCAPAGSENAKPVADDTGEPSAKPSKRKPETPFPPDMVLTQERLFYAVGKGMSERRAKLQFERFRNQAEAKDRRQINWDAAWRNWVLGEIDRYGKDVRTFDDEPERQRKVF